MCKTPKSYHQGTGYDRYAMEPHAMDWANSPDPYKSYAGLDGVALPEIQNSFDPDLFERDLQAVYAAGRVKKAAANPELEILSKVCLLAGGLTARSRQGDGYFYFRSAPSAGALYPNEIYFAALNSRTFPAGIYHFGVHNRFLTRLREGYFTNELRAALPGLPQDAGGVFVVSGIFFRSAWKYRKRAYRYVLMDAGHLVENLRLAIIAAGYSCRLHHAFDDRKLDRLLGFDVHREGTFCCIGMSGDKAGSVIPEAEPVVLSEKIQAASRVSPAEIVYPEIAGIHEASKIVAASDSTSDSTSDFASGAQSGMMIDHLGISLPDAVLSVPEVPVNTPVLSYSEAVFQRRSKRNFIPKSIENDQLNYLLMLLCRAVGQVDENPDIALSACTGFLVGRVKGIDPGFYLLDPVRQKSGQVFSGNMIEKMASVCLDQAWLKHAAVHFVFMSNLAMLETRWGARGYRYAMLTAGRLGHCLYLGATAMGLGCCGIGALYDNEAQNLLGLNDESALLYLVAVGNTK